MNPKLQRQLKEPMVFLQVPLPQASLSHSLISTKETKQAVRILIADGERKACSYPTGKRNNPLPKSE